VHNSHMKHSTKFVFVPDDLQEIQIDKGKKRELCKLARI
jgi:hypothetical protein